MDANAAISEIESSDLDRTAKRQLRRFLANYAHLLVACVPGDVVSTLQEELQEGDAVGLDIKDIQELAAFARRQREQAQTVRLSNLDQEKWETIQRTAGLSFEPFDQKGRAIKGLLLRPASAFKWSKEAEPSQAKEYLSHIDKHLMYDKDEYQLYDARRFRSWLTVNGMVEQLGFRMKGTTDAALVLTQAVESGLPSTTTKWLWELKRQLKASSAVTEVAAAVAAEAAHLPDAPDQPGSSAVDAAPDAKEPAQIEYAFQAMACLLLANIHAPNARPGITLTNLNDRNVLYWLDGSTITYYSAPDAATAWAMTNAFIQGESSSGSEEEEQHQIPAGLASVAKRQKLDLGKVAVGDATAGLSDLAAFLDDDEVKASQAASLLRELHGMPVFSGLARPLPDMMYA